MQAAVGLYFDFRILLQISGLHLQMIALAELIFNVVLFSFVCNFDRLINNFCCISYIQQHAIFSNLKWGKKIFLMSFDVLLCYKFKIFCSINHEDFIIFYENVSDVITGIIRISYITTKEWIFQSNENTFIGKLNR